MDEINIHLTYKTIALTDEADALTDEADALTDNSNVLTYEVKVPLWRKFLVFFSNFFKVN